MVGVIWVLAGSIPVFDTGSCIFEGGVNQAENKPFYGIPLGFSGRHGLAGRDRRRSSWRNQLWQPFAVKSGNRSRSSIVDESCWVTAAGGAEADRRVLAETSLPCVTLCIMRAPLTRQLTGLLTGLLTYPSAASTASARCWRPDSYRCYRLRFNAATGAARCTAPHHEEFERGFCCADGLAPLYRKPCQRGGIAAGAAVTINCLLRSLLLLCAVLCGSAAAQATPAAADASAIFAGGCFWCVEADFETLGGVQRVESGFTGGHVPEPTYEQVSEGGTGHAEAVRVWFDPAKISYAQLLDFFWHHIDPTVKDRQFCDVGHQYRSAIFYLDENQRRIAEASKAALEQSGKLPHVYTEITAAGPFYPAEEAHQNYHSKNPLRYKFYRLACGRDARVAAVWGSN
jgi:peptide-methionine (S)-S-oxide reductase